MSAGVICTIWFATSKTMDACWRSAAAPYTSALGSLSAYRRYNATAAASSLLPFFFGIDKGGSELAVPVRFYHAENVPDQLFLPRQKPEACTCPFAFGVTEVFDKFHGTIRFCFVVV